jgi:hypothetical protein
MSVLDGLKAVRLTTEAKPKLRLLFLPRFWGSFESRWERGKAHLVPSILQDWDDGDHTLCGIAYGESQFQGEIGPEDHLPRWICKSCHRVATKRGYGKR